MEKRICPYSCEEFIPKRRNQVFATPKNRVNFHNDNAAELRLLKAPFDKQLDKNFIILSELVAEGETKTFSRDKILIKGFNPDYFTNFVEYGGSNLRCLYHFVFFISSDNEITITYPAKETI